MLTENVSPEADLAFVRHLYDTGELPKCFEHLDHRDVKKTLQVVPHEILRLLVALLPVPDIDEKLSQLEEPEREPAVAAVQLARQHHGMEFLEAITKAGAEDPSIWKMLGIDVRPQEGREEKTENSWTMVEVRPELMLQSRRLYCMVAFWRDKELVFRSDVELDDVFWASRAFLQAAKQTLEALQKNAPGVNARTNLAKCRRELQAIQTLSQELAPYVNAGARQSLEEGVGLAADMKPG